LKLRNKNGPRVRVVDLKKHFPIYGGLFLRLKGWIQAVDGVNFEIQPGEILGLVGESGCGKTTLGRTVAGLIERTSGDVYFEGENIFELPSKEARAVRKKMQIVFQDPFSSLDPRMTLQQLFTEAYNQGPRAIFEKGQATSQLLELVGLPQDYALKYPHELSGGEAQRASVARSLAIEPTFLFADEPISALDVSIQARMIEMMRDLQQKLNLSILFVSHNLAVVRQISDRVGVMYLGKLVEIGATETVIERLVHPYTEVLFKSVPIPDPKAKMGDFSVIGEPGSAENPPPGCRFHPRCAKATAKCSQQEPEMVAVEEDYFVACHKEFA
jgi:oligopeptide/dipeptide ABC transporter ATP-binding protein